MKKILLIEDHLDVRENTADILELAGYHVSTAENGKVGVEKAVIEMPDLIVCDIMMPEMDGYEVLEKLNQNENTAVIPFIFLTAKTEKTEQRKGMNLGADDYLTKPFTEDELLEAVKSRLLRHDFLKEEFSRTIGGLSRFMKEASKYVDLEELSSDYLLTRHEKKDLLYSEGDAANALYFVQNGVVKTFKSTEKGKEIITGLISAGHFVGQLSLLSENGTYIESAMIIEDAELYQIPKAAFISLMHTNREVANKFVTLISNDLVEMQTQLINVAYSTVKQRTAKALLEIFERDILNNTEGGISIMREDLAALIGTATETSIRMLTQFKEEKLISFDGSRRIIIEDKKALEHIVLFG